MSQILPLVQREPWTDRAACRGMDPDLFYPEWGASTKTAKAVCARCDVRAECLQYAIDHNERHGIWGGQSTNQRKPRAKRVEVA